MKYGSASTNQLKYASLTESPEEKVDRVSAFPWEIAFDIDGVVADTMAVFVDLVREKLGIKDFSKEHICEYELHKCLPGISKDILNELICVVLSDEYTLRVPPCPGAPEFLRKLSQYSPLRFVTARIWPESITRWIHNILPDVPQEAIKVVATGDPDRKQAILREMNIKVFVEDRWDTCVKLRAEGFGIIVYDQPWNRKGTDFPRISHWRDLERFVIWPEKVVKQNR
ncbi:MAG: hypothetical protein WHS38_02140 [Thermodesulforhabdaceae bacterium]